MTQPPAPDGAPTDDTDDSLLADCLAGEESAWKLLVARHEPRLRALAGRLLGRKGHWDIVEDIVTAVWLSLWQDSRRRLQGFDPQRGSLATYLNALTRRAVQRQRRADGAWRVLVPLGTGEGIADPREQNPDWELLWDEFLPQLSERQREFLQGELPAAAAPLGAMPVMASSARKVRQRLLTKVQRFLRDQQTTAPPSRRI
jgi:DNA-directed RNA polymerase specialized sigma24 family protein